MNKQEAIDTLKAMQALQEIYRNEAVDMAIEALEAQQELVGATNEIYAKGYNAAKREIALSGEYERAYHRGKIDATKWIPVSERLPEDGIAVLITTENEEVYIDQVITDPYKERYFQSNTGYDNYQVIAWQPLPEPYKGGGGKNSDL